jgi:hypothetical protein
MSQILEQCTGLPHSRKALWLDGQCEYGIMQQDPDAQVTGVGPDLVAVRATRGWGDEEVARQ